MAKINEDYQLLRRQAGAGPRAASLPETPPVRPPSQAEVDSLIQSLGTEGPIDTLFDELDYFYFFWRNPPRLLGVRGRIALIALTAAAAASSLWAGWVLVSRYGGGDSVAWLMFGAAGLLAFIAAVEIRETLKARRPR